jgi:hypothetical protein
VKATSSVRSTVPSASGTVVPVASVVVVVVVVVVVGVVDVVVDVVVVEVVVVVAADVGGGAADELETAGSFCAQPAVTTTSTRTADSQWSLINASVRPVGSCP